MSNKPFGTDNKYFISPKPQFFSSENRILVVGLLLSTLILAISCFFIYQHFLNALDETYDSTVESLSTAISIAGMSEIQSNKPDREIHGFIDQLMASHPDIAYIEFQNSTGKTLFRNEAKSRLTEEGLRHQVTKLHYNNDPSQPIIGSIHIGMTGKSKDALSRATQMTVVFAFISAWIISTLAVVGITWILSKHLRSLVRGVKRLSTGDFGYRIPSNELWGELKHLAESFNDMSGRLRVYEDQNIDTLTFERNKLEAILLSITDGVLVADNDGEVVIINESACDMLDVQNREILLGSKITGYTTDDGEHCFEPVVRDFQQFLKDDYPETFVRSVEINTRTLRVIISSIKDTEENSLGYVMIMRDITREMEINKMKTQFISNVSHELRTPVTTIKSYVDTIVHHGNELDQETYKEFMETIHSETDRLKRMVNDILDFSRLEAPEYKMEMDYYDITPLINLTVQSIKMLAEQKKLKITTAIESNLPKVYMNSDSIERVLRNLLGNAIKYTPEGGRIKIRAEVVENGQELEVSVEDTGMGIPEEHLPHIWDRFYRVENEVHTVKGTGLGLHLVRVAVEEHHNGTVFVKTRVDQGSMFGFRLPLTAGGVLNDPVAEKNKNLMEA
jgi:two-component system, OmpR family, sensor histidine kinase NblS